MIVESSKDEANLVSGLFCFLGLFFIIYGSIPMTFPLSIIMGVYAGLGGMVAAYLFPILLGLLQTIGTLGIFWSVLKKETMVDPKGEWHVNLKWSVMILAIVDLFFILLCAFLTRLHIIYPTYSIILMIAPFITIVAGLLYQTY